MTKLMSALVAAHTHSQPQIKQIPRPELKPNEVLVAVAAASINPVDQKYRLLHYSMKLTTVYPLTLGNDFSGTIVARGAQALDFKVGDQVYGRVNHDRTGTFAEYLAIDQTAIAKVPTNLSLTAAAAVPLVGLTAYQALMEILALQAGQKIFINAGSGGVGSMAIQLAHAQGAEVATTVSERNRQLVADLGADHISDYHQVDFSTILHDYDAVFDTHGGADTQKALSILRPGGKLVSIANLPTAEFARERHLGKIRELGFAMASSQLTKIAQQQQVSYQFLLMHASGQQLNQLTNLIEHQQLRPIIDRTYPFAEIKQALDYAEQGHVTGKVVVTMK
ncbi:NADP-dependent oxidoreductase [Lapidilactobacillus wuchangensis]|uniref:NADP-dependent oxidoreductase n=1 Tax=Lapidilactobacillus wuchangensis TaxID=2486001 RepID=UPI002989E2C7|nr:NADP-dependent oxidoreductase [Lapidilactobacillus wuchangensis]